MVQVVLTFSQQGLGNFVNIGVLLILMCCFDTIHPIHNKKPKTYYPKRLEGVSPSAGCTALQVPPRCRHYSFATSTYRVDNPHYTVAAEEIYTVFAGAGMFLSHTRFAEAGL